MSKYIIDISHHHPVTDWAKAKEISHCLISKGTQGTDFVDDTLKSFVAGCEKNKIPYWLYCFPERGVELESAKFFLKTVKPLIGKYFVGYALDVESYTKKVNGVKKTFYITNDGAIKAMKLLQAEGHKTMLYSGQSEYSTFKTAINACIGENTAWWEARYGKNDGSYPDLNVYPIHDRCDLHQYCSTKIFSCFKGGVDISKVRQTPSGKDLDWYITPKGAKKEVSKTETTKTTVSEKTIKICGHGSGNPSVKVMYDYLSSRYEKKADNGKRKGIIAVRRLKAMDDAHRKQFHDTYKTILGRNIYSQDLRNYVYTKYSNGKYYSDCSSSGMATMRKIGYDVTNLNTAGIYWSDKFEKVPVEIVNGHITNPEILKVGDSLLFVGNDPSRPEQIGHVEFVYEITGETQKQTATTGKSYTGSYPTLPSRGYFKNGDVSSEVIKVKKFLNWAIGSKLTETNKNYFDKTVAEVKKFQKKVGLTADGEWGKNTQAKAKAFKK